MSKTTDKFSPKVRNLAIRMVLDLEAEHPVGRDDKALTSSGLIALRPDILQIRTSHAELTKQSCF